MTREQEDLICRLQSIATSISYTNTVGVTNAELYTLVHDAKDMIIELSDINESLGKSLLEALDRWKYWRDKGNKGETP